MIDAFPECDEGEWAVMRVFVYHFCDAMVGLEHELVLTVAVLIYGVFCVVVCLHCFLYIINMTGSEILVRCSSNNPPYHNHPGLK